MDIEYIAPISTVSAGGIEWTPTRWRVVSSRLEPFDVARVEIDNHDGQISITDGTEIEIRSGYREHGEWVVFRGIMTRCVTGVTLALEAKDTGMFKLSTAKAVPSSFSPANAVVVAQSIAAAAGVTLQPEALIQLSALPPKKQVVLAATTALVALRTMMQSWGIGGWDLWCDVDASLYIGASTKSSRALSFDLHMLERDENVIEMEPPQNSNSTGRVVTVGLPVRHSEHMIVSDLGFFGPEIVQVDRVTHSVWPHARTEVVWRQV
ncbi:MAG: hypothetical protein HUU55_07675 [Myxococcales bacterium]|nr:hypothetical protein [Myxococcales bacterium]